MKTLTKSLLALAFTSAITVTTALGQAGGPTWTVDENGPALLNGPVVGFANGFLKPDPISGAVGWYYPLGPSVPGDVLLLELPLTGSVTNSDLLRFDGQGVFFFSDLEPNEPNPDHADVPLIPIARNPIILDELGPEGNNGAFYTPGPGMPGLDTTGTLPGLAYNIISDAIPEPSSLALLFGGAGLLLLDFVRRSIRA